MFKFLLLAGLYFGLVEDVPVVMYGVAFGTGLMAMFSWMALWGQQPTSVEPIPPLIMFGWVLPSDLLIIGSLVWTGYVAVALGYVALILAREGLRHAALLKAVQKAAPEAP